MPKDTSRRRKTSHTATHAALLAAFRSQLTEVMQREGIGRTQLAKMLGVTPQAVTSYLTGNRNLTLRTMVKIALVLGQEVHLSFSQQGGA